jgi:predicted GIY-YIG superfamily endonuclease
MQNSTFYYVYIIQSHLQKDHFYTGFTRDLEDRLAHHNAGAVPATKPYRPWSYKTVVAFTVEQQAHDFEHYLKTQSGRAFAKKRL